jgi:ferric-dicitrate binding protein FerR (iron transport regulator)
MEQDQIIKYITGNLEETEAQEVRVWISTNDAGKSEFIRLKNIHALASEGKHILQINDEFLQLERQIFQTRQPSKLIMFRRYLKYAAVLITVLCVGFSLSEIRNSRPLSSEESLTNEFFAPIGQISEFTLADGSRVWLNSGTRIKVPANFSPTSRKLFMEGEAFFEVTKDPKHPFIVQTKELSIKVMGTSFNVSAYETEKNMEITLVEGVVGIRDRESQNIGKLTTGQQLIYDKATGTNRKRVVNTCPYEAWRDGKMIFKDRTLEYIAERLERWYSVKINFKDQTISQIKFTGTILKNKPLSQVLEAITLTAPIRFDIKINTDQKNQVLLYSLKNN